MSRKLNFKEMLLFSEILNDVEINKLANIEGTKQEITLKILTYVISNLYKSGIPLCKLIASYKGIDKDIEYNTLEGINLIADVSKYDSDDIIETFKEMFTNGLPKVLQNMIDVESLKKKLE